MMLPSRLQEILERAGWFPTRHVSTERWTSVLEAEGFSPLEGAVKLLAEYGGLTLTPQLSSDCLFAPEPIIFDPVLAASGELDRVDEWQRVHNRKLYPLARVGDLEMMLYSDRAELVGAWMRHVNLLGNSLPEALELLLFAQKYPRRLSSASDTPWWEDES